MKMTPELLDHLAREYVLGTLQGGARRRFATLARQQPAAAQALQAWGARLGRLGETAPAVQPSPQLWRGVEQRLFGAPAKPVRWWQRAGFGFGGAFAGAALCALLLLPRIEQQKMIDEESLPASYVGLLSDAAGKPTVLASATRQGHRLAVKLLQPVAIPSGQVAQLWALPDDGGAPRLVGYVPGSGKAQLILAGRADAVFAKVSRLAVSIEPAPGGDAPAHPYVLSGACVKLW